MEIIITKIVHLKHCLQDSVTIFFILFYIFFIYIFSSVIQTSDLQIRTLPVDFDDIMDSGKQPIFNRRIAKFTAEFAAAAKGKKSWGARGFGSSRSRQLPLL